MPKSRDTTGTNTDADTRFSDDMITKVGRAVGQVVTIQHAYTQAVQAADSDEEKAGLSGEAERSAVQAIRDEGISVNEYNAVVSAADNDPDLQQRLLAAVPTNR
jgi:uncharacterized protein (DUF2147 family)